jgi:hypothetical protein
MRSIGEKLAAGGDSMTAVLFNEGDLYLPPGPERSLIERIGIRRKDAKR